MPNFQVVIETTLLPPNVQGLVNEYKAAIGQIANVAQASATAGTPNTAASQTQLRGATATVRAGLIGANQAGLISKPELDAISRNINLQYRQAAVDIGAILGTEVKAFTPDTITSDARRLIGSGAGPVFDPNAAVRPLSTSAADPAASTATLYTAQRRQQQAATAAALADERYVQSASGLLVTREQLRLAVADDARATREEALVARRNADAPNAGGFQNLRNSFRPDSSQVLPSQEPDATQLVGSRLLTTASYGAAAGVLYGIVNETKQAVQEALALQDAMSRLNAQANALGETAGVASFRRDLLGIARDTGTSSAEVVTLGIHMRGAFESTQAAVEATAEAVRAAQVSGLPLEQVMNSLLAASISYGVSIDTITDKSIGLEQRFGILSKEALTTFGDVANSAKEAGLSVDEIGGVVGVLTQRLGQSGSTIAGALDRIFPAVQTKAPDILLQADAAPGLRDQIPKLQQELQQGQTGQVLLTLAGSWDNLTKAQQNNLVTTIASRRDIPVLQALFAGNKKILDEVANANQDVGKAAEVQAAKQQTLSYQLQRTREEIAQIVDALGRLGAFQGLALFLGLLQGGIGIIATFVRDLAQLNDAAAGIPGRMLAIAGAIVLVTKAVGAAGALKDLLGKFTAGSGGLFGRFGGGGGTGATEVAGGEAGAGAGATEAAATVTGAATEAAATTTAGATEAAATTTSAAAEAAATTTAAAAEAAATATGAATVAAGEVTGAAAGAGAELTAGATTAAAELVAAATTAAAELTAGGATAGSEMAAGGAAAGAASGAGGVVGGVAEAAGGAALTGAETAGGGGLLAGAGGLVGGGAIAGLGVLAVGAAALYGAEKLWTTHKKEQAEQRVLQDQLADKDFADVAAIYAKADSTQRDVIGTKPLAVSSQRSFQAAIDAGVFGGKDQNDNAKKLLAEAQGNGLGATGAQSEIIQIISQASKSQNAKIKAAADTAKGISDAVADDGQAAVATAQELAQQYQAGDISFTQYIDALSRQIEVLKGGDAATQKQATAILQQRNQAIDQQVTATATMATTLRELGGENADTAKIGELRIALSNPQFTDPGARADTLVQLLTAERDAIKTRIQNSTSYAEALANANEGATVDPAQVTELTNRLTSQGVDPATASSIVASVLKLDDRTQQTMLADIKVAQDLAAEKASRPEFLTPVQSALADLGDAQITKSDETQYTTQTQRDLDTADVTAKQAALAQAERSQSVDQVNALSRIQTATAGGNAVLAAQIKLDQAKQLQAFIDPTNPAAALEAEAGVIEADKGLADAERQHQLAQVNALLDIRAAQAHGNQALLDQIGIERADAAKQYADPSDPDAQAAAAAAAITARSSAGDNARQRAGDVAAARLDIAVAKAGQNQELLAQLAKERADEEAAYAPVGDAAAQLRAEAARITADQQVQAYIQDAANARIELAIAMAQSVGDTAKVAQLTLDEASANLANITAQAAAGSADQADVDRAQAAVVKAKTDQTNQARTQREDDLAYLYATDKITAQQYIASLTLELSKIPESNVAARREIETKINDLRKSLSSNLQFNIGDIKLPTYYDAKRLEAGGGVYGVSTSTVDNRVTNIQLNATSTAEVQAGFQAILTALQAPPVTGNRPRTYP